MILAVMNAIYAIAYIEACKSQDLNRVWTCELAISYEINHQVSYDTRSYESNLWNCIYRSLKKSELQQGLIPDLVIPVWRSNQSSYEATDFGSWSFVGPKKPVRNECEVLI